MLEEREALRRILDSVEVGPVIWLPLIPARNHILAQDLTGVIDSPTFDNSSMDGYAVRAEEAVDGAVLAVSENEQSAGVDQGYELQPGEAIRIFTGAAIPGGCDAVIMQEDVERDGEEITITEGVIKGENIRRQGGDICTGQKLLSQGDVLTPSRIGLLAAQGFPEIPVHCKPMVNVVSTGDELVDQGSPLIPGEIYNSNGPMLQAAVEEAGAVGSTVHAVDDKVELRSILSDAISTGDMVIIAGGVSVGDRDFVKEVLEDLGVETGFWRVKVKPGKPFLFGKHPGGCLIFGLPGNPVSAYVTFSLFVRPAIERRLGFRQDALQRNAKAIAAESMANHGDRPHYLRGVLEGGTGKVSLSGTQQSHAVFGLSKANCLIRIEPGNEISIGDSVEIVRM